MPSNKFSPRRRSHKRPPICLSIPPRRILTPYPPPYYGSIAGARPPANYHQIHAVSRPTDPPFPRIHRRNLIAHLYAPLDSWEWRHMVIELQRHWPLFNGKKIIAIPTAKDLHPPHVLQSYFPPGATFIHTPNDRRLREVATFLPLLQRIRSLNKHEATFYCHSKGTSPFHVDRPNTPQAIRLWTTHLFWACLTQWKRIHQLLKHHAAASAYLIDYSGIPNHRMTSPTGLTLGTWHFAGTFFWFRNEQIFSRKFWSAIPDDPFAAEMWLGSFVPAGLAGSLPPTWHPPKTNPPDLYEPGPHPTH